MKKEKVKPILINKEIEVLLRILNMPRQQDLKSAGFCINLSNKLSKMVDELEKPEPEPKK